MSKPMFFFVALFVLAMTGFASTEGRVVHGPPVAPEFSWSEEEPIIRAKIAADLARLKLDEIPNQLVLTSIVTWLSTGFDLPINYDHPIIERTAQSTLTAVPQGSHFVSQRGLLSRYDDARHVIYLPADWNGDTPEGASVLIHEMVHHLQNVGGLQYGCAQDREKLAYVAQEKWLATSKRDLAGSFGINAEMFLFITECYIP